MAAAFTLTVQVLSIPEVITQDQNTDPTIPSRSNAPAACGLPPPLVVLGCSGFGNVDGLLESSPQVNGSLLDHFPDVLDPVLLVLNIGSLK